MPAGSGMSLQAILCAVATKLIKIAVMNMLIINRAILAQAPQVCSLNKNYYNLDLRTVIRVVYNRKDGS